KNIFSPMRTTEWSSTMRTRIGAGSGSDTSAPDAVTASVGVEGTGRAAGDTESNKGPPRRSGCDPLDLGGGLDALAGGDDRGRQLRGSEGLAHEPIGATREGCGLERVGPAHRQDPNARKLGTKTGDEGDPAIDLGQARVDDDDIGAVGDRELERFTDLAGARDDHALAADREKTGEAFPDPIIRIDDQDSERAVNAGAGLRHVPIVGRAFGSEKGHSPGTRLRRMTQSVYVIR